MEWIIRRLEGPEAVENPQPVEEAQPAEESEPEEKQEQEVPVQDAEWFWKITNRKMRGKYDL